MLSHATVIIYRSFSAAVRSEACILQNPASQDGPSTNASSTREATHGEGGNASVYNRAWFSRFSPARCGQTSRRSGLWAGG